MGAKEEGCRLYAARYNPLLQYATLTYFDKPDRAKVLQTCRSPLWIALFVKVHRK
jgi:hypothetical protein